MHEGYISRLIEHPDISIRDVSALRTYQPNARRIVDVGFGPGASLTSIFNRWSAS